MGLTVLAPLLAYGLARLGLGMSQSTEEPQRGVLRNFARWLLIGVPIVTIGLATGDGVAVVLGAMALFVAGRHIGWGIHCGAPLIDGRLSGRELHVMLYALRYW